MGIPRPALAAQVGISYKHLFNIEKDSKGSAIETLWRIAKALELPIEDVVASDGPKGPGVVDKPQDDEGRWSA